MHGGVGEEGDRWPEEGERDPEDGRSDPGLDIRFLLELFASGLSWGETRTEILFVSCCYLMMRQQLFI